VKQTVLNLLAQRPPDPSSTDRRTADLYLNDFYPTTVSEVSKLLSRLPNKTSPLDYIHTSVLKSCSDAFAPLISHLANLSFAEGTFPSSFKEAQVTPLLKKTGLDGDDPANYRPISNLNTISKVIERLALARLLPHVAASGNFNPLQSAYRKQHSTETALVKILDDLYRVIDEQKAAVLIGLDLSAAFDTIDHDTLINRLQSVFGVTGVALEWIEAYLRGRSQYVKIGSERSLRTPCDIGVPQGSVLGPFLFSIYVSPISDIISSFGIQYHQYADDTQLYTAVKSGSEANSIANLESCTIAVRDWFVANGMLLNPEKSEVLLVGSRAQVKKFAGGTGVAVAGSNIKFSVQLKSLGVTLDQGLTFDQHVRNVVKASNFHIRALRHIRPLLTREVANTVACSIVSTRLDYCNSLLYGTSQKNISKLQRVQNSLARVVADKRCRREHIHPVLKELHWLPIAQRVEYKLALMTFKVLTLSQPHYLADIITEYKPSRELRSSSQRTIARRQTKTVTGQRAFSFASRVVWGSLPESIRSCEALNPFKVKLKTFLFARSYCT